MVERSDAITNEVLGIVTFVLVYPTVFDADKASDSECTYENLCK